MPIFLVLIIMSIVIYIYFKVKIINSKDPLYIQYTNSKARIALGIFITTFAMNQYYIYQTKLALFISILLIILGISQLVFGSKLFKHYRKEMLKFND